MFELESSGSLKPENIVKYAIAILNDKLELIKKGIIEEAKLTNESFDVGDMKMED